MEGSSNHAGPLSGPWYVLKIQHMHEGCITDRISGPWYVRVRGKTQEQIFHAFFGICVLFEWKMCTFNAINVWNVEYKYFWSGRCVPGLEDVYLELTLMCF